MNTTEVRRISPSDIIGIRNLISEWWSSGDVIGDTENIEFQMSIIGIAIKERNKRGVETFVVAVEKDTLLGLLGYNELPPKTIMKYSRTERPMQISVLMVSRSRSKTGVGKFLLAWIEQYARSKNCTEIILTSSIRWQESWSFYLKQRYQDLGEIEGRKTRIFSKIL